MKIIIAILVVFSIGYADDMEKQCQYIVYGNGHNDMSTNGYLAGIMSGQLYATDKVYKNSSVKNENNRNLVGIACKEALANNNTNSFNNKYLWGVSIVIDSRFSQYSKLK